MTAKALVFAFVLAASDAARRLFRLRQPAALVHVLDDVECPPYFYLRVDDRVFPIKLR